MSNSEDPTKQGLVTDIIRCLAPSIGTVLSPTRRIIDSRKDKPGIDKKRLIKDWNLGFFLLSIAVSAWLFALEHATVSFADSLVVGGLFGPVLIYLAISRCNEIAYAFYTDALDKIPGERPASNADAPRAEGIGSNPGLTARDRVLLAGRSYIEVIISFALIHYFLPSSWYERRAGHGFRNIVEAIYFSGVTITTVGYGDIVPTSPLSQLICNYETVIGIVIIVLAIATYLSWQQPSVAAQSPPAK